MKCLVQIPVQLFTYEGPSLGISNDLPWGGCGYFLVCVKLLSSGVLLGIPELVGLCGSVLQILTLFQTSTWPGFKNSLIIYKTIDLSNG